MKMFAEDAIERYLDIRISRRITVGDILTLIVVMGIIYEIAKP